MAKTVIRNKIADYLNIGTTATEQYALMGVGYNKLDESPNAQTQEKAYISDANKTKIVTGYAAQFGFDVDVIADEPAVMEVYDIGTDQLQGSDAERDYVRVDLFKGPVGDPDSNEFPARKFRVSVETSSIEGAGTEIVRATGNLNQQGSMVKGTFNTQTRTFTPNSEVPTP